MSLNDFTLSPNPSPVEGEGNLRRTEGASV